MFTVILVMGVSGCGKSTVGLSIAQHLSFNFLEGDDFHPPANKDKMAAGLPLTDSDRLPWLQAIKTAVTSHNKPCKYNSSNSSSGNNGNNNNQQQLEEEEEERGEVKDCGVVLSCSALKRAYRELLFGDLDGELLVVYLEGSYEELAARMGRRLTQGSGHFMPVSLLKSQFEALEVPTEEEMEALAVAEIGLTGGLDRGRRRMLCKVSLEQPLEQEIEQITSFIAASRQIL